MYKSLGISLIIIFLFSAGVQAQNKYSKAADDAFTDQAYSLALTRYQKAYSKVKKNKAEKDRISLRMADCYRLMNNTKKAEVAYKRLATGKYAKEDPKVILFYADMLKANGNYDEAIVQYTAYLEKVPKDAKAAAGVETCNQAKEWMKNPSKYDVKWEKKINSKEDDFAPAYADKTQSSIIFTSDRPAAFGKDLDNWTGMEFSDLFIARKDRKGEWGNPTPADVSELLNTKANEGSGQFNSRYTMLYFTRCWNELRRKNGCGIYKVNRMGQSAWGEPEKMELGGDSSSVFGQPSPNSDESVIYFAAELTGGYGGKDIWMVSKKGGKGKNKSRDYGSLTNLGPKINTAGDEMFPFIRNDSILYFASNGHKGMGGLDIFRAVADSGKFKTDPENMKYPINTFADDFAIVFNPEAPEEGYFSSNRPGGKGRDDIYSFVVPPLLFTLEGNVTDDRTLQPIQGAKVMITGTNGKSLSDNTDEKGHYSFNKNQIFPNTTYEIFITKEDYFNEKGKETTVGIEKSKDLVRNFVLKPIPKKPVVLPDILYDLGKWDLKPQFRDSLQGLIATLDANETIVIELASHTDTRDIDERNDILSQRRAQSVVDYLITRGIDPDRLVAKGYGERVPRTLAKDVTKDGYTFKAGTVLTDSVINSLPNTQLKEEAHALNRRTEFTILRNDYVPKNVTGKPVSKEIQVVQNPEENVVPFSLTSDGLPEATCYISGITENFRYDKKETNFFVSSATALRLLKTGVIDKTDFEGDAEKIIGEGTIAEKAVFNIREMRIGNNTVKDIKATVNSKIKTTILFGENTLSRFGAFTIDEKESLLIFQD